MKNFKELKGNLQAKAGMKKAAKAAEQAEFNALSLEEKEEIRTLRGTRRATYVAAGAVVVGIGVAAVATVVAAKRGGEGGSVLEPTNSEYEAICASYE